MEIPTENLTVAEIKKRLVKSFAGLTMRQVALRAISFVTLNIILARALPVETLGIFNIATAIVTFFAYFADIGLAASLIQKKTAVSKEEIRTVFTIQLILVSLISLAVLLGAPLASDFYNLNEDGVWLIRALGIAFLLSSLKVVPAVMQERQLRFQSLVTVEIVEALVFNGLLVVMVLSNYGLWSFTVAALARGIIGTGLLYLLAPVPVGIAFHKNAAKELLSFGVPFQANTLLALVKDRLVPLVVARMIGDAGMGYITWAQNLAFLPLEIMNIVIRITFPAYSRLQDNPEALGKAVEKSLFLTSLMVYPILFGIGALLPSLIHYVVSPKWEPAVSSFYLFSFTTILAVISTTFANILNAVGHIKTTLKLMVMWTVLTWVLTPILVWQVGFIGVALASFLISFSSVVTIIIVKRILTVKVLDSISIPLINSIVMGGVVYLFAQLVVRDIFTMGLAIALGVVVYGGLVLAVARARIFNELASLRHA